MKNRALTDNAHPEAVNVCIVSTSFPRWKGDFYGPMVWNLIRWLEANGCRVRVVTQHYPGSAVREKIGNVEVHRFRYVWPSKLERIGTVAGVIDDLRDSFVAKLTLPLFLLVFAWKVWRISRDCDLLHVQWVPTMAVALPAKYLRRIPLIVNCRTNPDTKMWRRLYRLLLPFADHLIYNSAATQRSNEEVWRNPHGSVIGSGNNIGLFERPVGSPARPEHPAPFRILVVARLVEYKGIEYLIRALHSISRDIQFRLDLISDGPLRQELETLSKTLGLDEAIRFHGVLPTPELLQHMWSADLFVLPSIIDRYGRTEGFGGVLLEALAARVPIIASRVGGIVDIVNGTNGVLVEPKDVPGLAAAIKDLVQNPAKRRSLAEAGYDWLQEHFSDEAMARAYRGVYGAVLQIDSRLGAETSPGAPRA